MQRTPLSQGEKINLVNRVYTIDSVLGDGATCIVYSAHYEDNMGLPHRVNIKECYPYQADIIRKGNLLIWNSDEEREKCLETFSSTYEKLMLSQIGNFTVHAFDIDEANETQYIIMDTNDGVTFDNEATESIVDIMKTVKLLAYVAGKYHEKGYLHLDIKPSNFLVYTRPSEHIILFDIDTITSIEDIKSGKVKFCAYSDDWAAPEQKQRRISKFCPATDIFSIGAVLFEKIMGRHIECSDVCLFADWELSSKYFENINPKLKRLIRTIFKKTLAANIKRRYQTTQELIADLDEAILVAQERVYLISDCPANTINFVGRREELCSISQTLSNDQIVFLHGEGGIGKSSLAIAYSNEHRDEYDAVIFLRYKNSLKDLLDNISIQNFEGDENERHSKLKGLLDKHILLIVDNFDIEINDENEYLDQILSFNCHIIFTTRTDFSIMEGNVSQIEIKGLPAGDALRIFENACDRSLSNYEYTQLPKLFKLVGFNTYVIELLGRQISASNCSVNDLFVQMSTGIDMLYDSEEVCSKKDGSIVIGEIPTIIRTLFNIAKLDEQCRLTLRNLFLLNFLNIDKTTYREFARAKNVNTLNKLSRLGWVRFDGKYFSLHPLIEELVKTDMPPCKENCPEVFAVFNEIAQRIIIKETNPCSNSNHDDNFDARIVEFNNHCRRVNDHILILAFFATLNLSLASNRKIVLDYFINLINNNNHVGDPESVELKPIFTALLDLSSSSSISNIEQVIILFIHFISLENILHTSLSPTDNRFSMDLIINKTSSPFESFFHEAEEKAQKAFDILTDIEKDEVQALFPSYFSQKTGNETSYESDSDFTEYSDCFSDDLSDNSTKISPQEIFSDNSMNTKEKIRKLNKYCNAIFNKFRYIETKDDTHKTLESLNFTELAMVIEKLEEMILTSDTSFTESTPIRYKQLFWINKATFSILYANRTDFSKSIESLISFSYEDDNQLINFTPGFYLIMHICKLFDKCHYLLPYLFSALLEAERFDSYYEDEFDFIEIYDSLVECAEHALSEPYHQDCKYELYVREIINNLNNRFETLQNELGSFGIEDFYDVFCSPFFSLMNCYNNAFFSSVDKPIYLQSIIENKNLLYRDKTQIIAHCIDNAFGNECDYDPAGITGFDFISPPKLPWDILSNILQIEEQFLEANNSYDKDYSKLKDKRIAELTPYKAITTAFTNDVSEFKTCFHTMFLSAQIYATNALKKGVSWTELSTLRSSDYKHLYYAINTLMELGKCSWALPQLIRFEKGWKEYALRNNCNSEKNFHPIYIRIVECARGATKESDIPAEYQLNFESIASEYQQKIDNITGKNYSFKPVDE